MSCQSYQQSMLRFLLTVGVVCALTLTTFQESASATCGDYLSDTGHDDSFLTDPVNLPNLTHTPHHLPCSGPQCQNQRPDPSPMPPVIVITTLKLACSLDSETDAHRPRMSISANSQTSILSGDHRRRIERPPQICGC